MSEQTWTLFIDVGTVAEEVTEPISWRIVIVLVVDDDLRDLLCDRDVFESICDEVECRRRVDVVLARAD